MRTTKFGNTAGAIAQDSWREKQDLQNAAGHGTHLPQKGAKGAGRQ